MVYVYRAIKANNLPMALSRAATRSLRVCSICVSSYLLHRTLSCIPLSTCEAPPSRTMRETIPISLSLWRAPGRVPPSWEALNKLSHFKVQCEMRTFVKRVLLWKINVCANLIILVSLWETVIGTAPSVISAFTCVKLNARHLVT